MKLNTKTWVGGLWSLAYLAGGFVLIGAVWQSISWLTAGELPGLAPTFAILMDILLDPFYYAGPNDQGIGLQLLSSLKRVALGFGVGVLVAVPLGIAIGASPTLMKMLNPFIQILRPVSPLAWFPIGLATLKSAESATFFVIFITSLWPTVINTAAGVSSIPQDFKNVAKAYGFSKWKYVTKVVLPFSLPHIFTGLRLSVGIAWLVIVAAEMLSGGIGIGFFVWDSWNSLSLEKVLSAILIIGITGLLLDKLFNTIQNRFAYDK
jgi:nitrate/nitrite transport system permease protein